MIKYLLAIAVFFTLFCLSCTNHEQNKVPADANLAYYDSIKHMTGLEFQPRIQEADSVQVLFYTNPDGDPKKYTRYYSWYPTGDSVILASMKQSVNKHFERIEKVKDCRSEGKMYFFFGGNPLQTVYFSNRGDSCNHLYFIADGWFYYMPMDSSSANLFDELKKLSVDPPSDMQQ